MRAVIFVNGRLDEHDRVEIARLLREDDYLLGADGGARHCLALGRQPHVVVGDLDSLDAAIVEELTLQGVLIDRHLPVKDQTDLELTIERAIRDGADEILLVGATGGRLDQAFANLLILAQREWSAILKVIDNGQIAQVLRCGQRIELHDHIGATLSILPLTPRVKGITYTGVAYPLENASLRFGSTRGISNKIVASPATVEVRAGLLLVVWEYK